MPKVKGTPLRGLEAGAASRPGLVNMPANGLGPRFVVPEKGIDGAGRCC